MSSAGWETVGLISHGPRSAPKARISVGPEITPGQVISRMDYRCAVSPPAGAEVDIKVCGNSCFARALSLELRGGGPQESHWAGKILRCRTTFWLEKFNRVTVHDRFNIINPQLTLLKVPWAGIWSLLPFGRGGVVHVGPTLFSKPKPTNLHILQ